MNESKQKVELPSALSGEIEGLTKISEKVEDMEEDPILKPLSEYHKIIKMFSKEDMSEAQYLTGVREELNKILDSGFFDNSRLRIAYDKVLSVHNRMFFIYNRYTNMADEKMVEVRKVVEKYYISKKKYLIEVAKLNAQIEKLKKEVPKPKEVLKLKEKDGKK